MFDLLVEFYEDYFERNPMEAHRQSDGEIQLKDTGDTLIDKWEQELADGKVPDLWESFSPSARDGIKARLKTKKSGIMNFGDVHDHVQRQQNQSTLKKRSGWDGKALFGDESD